jgi:hypothetical protein
MQASPQSQHGRLSKRVRQRPPEVQGAVLFPFAFFHDEGFFNKKKSLTAEAKEKRKTLSDLLLKLHLNHVKVYLLVSGDDTRPAQIFFENLQTKEYTIPLWLTPILGKLIDPHIFTHNAIGQSLRQIMTSTGLPPDWIYYVERSFHATHRTIVQERGYQYKSFLNVGQAQTILQQLNRSKSR